MSGLKPATGSMQPTRCLLVDDNRGCIAMMARILRLLGQSDIDVATEGKAAFDMMRASDYGLVISDLHMGDWSGLDLIRRVRANERLRNTPMVLTTADTDIDNIRTARESGADAYILKPYSAASLRGKIEPILRNAAAARRTPATEVVIRPIAGPPPQSYTSFLRFSKV